MFEIRMLLQLLASQRVSDSATSGWVWELSLGEWTRRTRANWNGESGRFVLVKESFDRTDSFANDPSLVNVY